MPSPFPGMNPYLENPELWSEVHHRLLKAIADAIASSTRPKYQVAIEKCTYFSGGENAVLVGTYDMSVLPLKLTTNQISSTATIDMSWADVLLIKKGLR